VFFFDDLDIVPLVIIEFSRRDLDSESVLVASGVRCCVRDEVENSVLQQQQNTLEESEVKQMYKNNR